MRLATTIIVLGVTASLAGAVTVTEDFAAAPATRGWSYFGDTNLFQWDEANQNLAITWDSSRSNSYLHLPLGTIISRYDDCRVELDLRLDDVEGGVNPLRPGPMQLAFGFQNRTDAQRTNFIRGTGNNSPNLVEFNFFPDTGFGPTVWPAVMSTNSILNYTDTGDFSIYDLPLAEWMHVTLAYTASNQTIITFITTNGVLVGPVTVSPLTTNSAFNGGLPFNQFKVDTFALASYSELGVPTGSFAGSILAHGAVDNLVITVPPPPVLNLRDVITNNFWRATFLSRTNWSYALEATENFQTWNTVAAPVIGSDGDLVIVDTNTATFNARFYRVNARRTD